MQDSLVSSSKADTWRWAALLLTAALLGLVSEEIAFGLTNPERWVSDFVVGISLVGLGLVALLRERGTGSLLLASGLSWWLANVLSPTQYLHRGFMLHAIAIYPGWRTSRIGAVGLLLAYVGACSPPIAATDLGTASYGIAVVTVASVRLVGTAGRRRRQRSLALLAATALAVGTTGGALVRILSDNLGSVGVVLRGYQLMLVVAAALLVIGLRILPTKLIADLVVDLEDRSGTVRDTLARLLGDPMLAVGYRDDDEGFVDAQGRAIDLPPVGGSRVATVVERDTREPAVIVHDRSLLSDGLLMEAISSVARLSASNAQLNAEARARVSDLSTSRSRLLTAEDEERRRLAEQLHRSVDATLAQVEISLSTTAHTQSTDRSTQEATTRALEQLRLARQDIMSIAQGLDPWQNASDLAEALHELADRSSIPVELVLTNPPIPPEAASTVYYICAEAVTNALKHAQATHIRVAVTGESSQLTVTVVDDGVGGAHLAGGTGLRGLADRLADLGGELVLESEKGSGTTLLAHIPCGQT